MEYNGILSYENVFCIVYVGEKCKVVRHTSEKNRLKMQGQDFVDDWMAADLNLSLQCLWEGFKWNE